ncbi:MAG: hypothetical protein JSV30_06800 [Candidatus Omnitrophota bacterium]|nr:MAG: hypothetical protein JSV30_06800 [Candidatus Omnitrophota bacterium]
MPTYEYQCKKCAHKFDVFQQMSDEPLKNCPACGGELKRLLGSGSGIIFKGSGFYATDYRSKEYNDRKKQESKPCDGASCKDCPANKDK